MNNVMHPTALPRHIAGITIATVGFIAACNYGQGWFMPIVTYICMFAAIIGTAAYHLPADKRASSTALFAINGLGCSLLVSALWFSGRMGQMF